jgi:hypothetical protein
MSTKKAISRREFLRAAATVTASAVLAACTPKQAEPTTTVPEEVEPTLPPAAESAEINMWG